MVIVSLRRVVVALVLLPVASLAVGFDEDDPPKPTPTTQDCTAGTVWDAETKACVAPKDSRLDDDERLRAVRELAYAGRIPEAVAVLDAITDQGADAVLTYRGFTARKQGDADAALRWYRAALDANPDNILARSYMGQGFVEQGEITLARAELTEIRRRGGRGTWAELSLRLALDSGRGYNH